jgi:hypothetical protein
MYTFSDFHLASFAVFTFQAFAPDRAPDFISGSGSCYWYEGDTVIRESDHWGPRIASCAWLLQGDDNEKGRYLVGACKLSDFVQIKGSVEYSPKPLFAAHGNDTILWESPSGHARIYDVKY